MTPGIDVVVASAHGRGPIAVCLRALEREAGDGLRDIRAETAWEARQQALATSTADVIAFVDSNVVVPVGWLDALRATWESSPHSVAAVGGPIRADAADWDAGRLGLIDLGDEVLELDPAKRTLFGGNLSFWRRSLIGVGGFRAPVDGRDATDWLSEEHEAQRQLGHWGWLVRYDPALAVERALWSGGAFGRSWRYGVRSGIAGSRPSGTALRQGIRSGAGAVAALTRGRRADAVERAARAAENLGVVAGSRRAPAAARGPGVVRTTSTTAAAKVDLVLLYHRFATGHPDPLGLCVSPANFQSQLAVLGEQFDVVRLDEIAATVSAGEAGSGRIAITIDDGYIDNLTTGIPLLTEAGLPATLFAATGPIETGRQFFWDEMQRLITGPGRRPAKLRINGRSWETVTPEQREIARRELHRLTQPSSSSQIEQTLVELRDWAGVAAGEPTATTRPITVKELKRIARTRGIEVGAHTRDHVNLGHQPTEEIRAQVERSRDDVRAWTRKRPSGFSYPFGIPRHDVSDKARRAVVEAGFEYAVVNQPVAVETGGDPFAIPRVFAPDVGADRFLRWLRDVLN
ncbi:MAG TPA: polysaccharide deacetylase family protein [Thermoleophilaceae bacterium]|jgi:peptidoglycan/xylan/chitin deacetylase (PgdA/CDA1 family)|nr:polysaccharide deacetylase family protein [Thermoleophilaceae bacterium]